MLNLHTHARAYTHTSANRQKARILELCQMSVALSVYIGWPAGIFTASEFLFLPLILG